MYLEGCKWDYKEHKLDDSDPKKLFTEIPLILLVPVVDRVIPKAGIYNCPVYKVLSRAGTLSTTGHSTNFVMTMELPSSVIEDKWIKAGVAAFLSLRY
jgi:dynein heavy chain